MPHGNAKRFCKRNHDTAICGRDKWGMCRDCERERTVRRLAMRPRKMKNRFCKYGHDKAVVGQTTNGHCLPCSRQRDLIRTAERRARVSEIKSWLAEIKTKSGCVECGYNKAPVALDFDHLPGFKKIRDISNMAQHPTRNAKEEILSELSKCEVVCSNCHRIRTANRAAGAIKC